MAALQKRQPRNILIYAGNKIGELRSDNNETHNFYFSAVMLVLTVFAGCSAQTAQTAESTDAAAATLASDTTDGDAMFTDRDKEVGYSEAESTLITLADNATKVSGAGVTIAENTITISAEGTFILSGSLSNG